METGVINVGGQEHPHHEKEIKVVIDHRHYEFPVDHNPYTGQQILDKARIGPDYHLYLHEKKHGKDRLIQPDERVMLENGMHFYVHHEKEIKVLIDKKHYEFLADGNPYTGQEIRDKAGIGSDYDLYLRAEKHGEDRLVQPDEHIRLHNDMCFYSIKRVIQFGELQC